MHQVSNAQQADQVPTSHNDEATAKGTDAAQGERIRLAGMAVLVSGGARGMGAAIAREIVGQGGQVAVADLLEKEGQALVDSLGRAACFIHLDVTEEASWERAVRATQDRFGQLGGLVNNAGILLDGRVETTTQEQWHRTIAVNQLGVFLGMKTAAGAMRLSGGGSIVNISSTAGMTGFTDCFAYVASKWAVRGMTKAAALELAQYGIRVNSVHPGDTMTDMIMGAVASTGAITTHDQIPLGRYADPSDISKLVLFLLSAESSYISGAEHVIDGAATAGTPSL